MKIICISGRAQNGKDTCAQFLKEILEEQGYDCLITHYGDLLKYICKMFFDWNGEKDERGRTLLQTVGTDCIRRQNPDYWVDFISGILDMLPDQWDVVIIPDARFPNEIYKLREKGYKVYHVRVNRVNFESPLTEEQLNHPSETALNDERPNFTVVNNTLDQFKKSVEVLADTIFKFNRGK